MFMFATSDQKEVRRFRIAQFNGRTATVRSAGSAVTGHVRSIVENKPTPALRPAPRARSFSDDLC
jgi:hypothetical protein